ncbi:MAG: HAD-IC family P-type ATPase [Candidatus Kerfeldbacteria bacterium]|nr:HAD-IC family P-type ATPase [Candidatus Kerfeldbacteria bacterium]
MPLHHQGFQTPSDADVVRLLDSSPGGLAGSVAAERRLHDGPNVLPRNEQAWFGIVVRQFATPLVGLLALAALVAAVLGETSDLVTVIGIILLNGCLGFIQEFRSARSLAALRAFLRQTATVVRDGGAIRTVERSDLVRGDVVLLAPGDQVPADLRLLAVDRLSVDESTLTGESDQQPKQAGPLPQPTELLHQSTNLLFAGTFIRSGQGRGVVIATGYRTVLGSIAELVAETKRVSAFEQNLKTLSRFLLRVVAVSLAAVFVINLLTKSETISLAEQLLFAMALAVSVVPEALPAVTTITLSRGALQLARRHVVVKRLTAIEDLGHIDVLCTDKTGTLTENKPSVSTIIATDRTALLTAWLESIPPSVKIGARSIGDPFDLAVTVLAQQEGLPPPDAATLDQVPFSPERRRSGSLVRSGRQLRYIVRGAPETVLPACASGSGRLSQASLSVRLQELGRAGERVLAVAVKRLDARPTEPLDSLEQGLELVGLITFRDPLKPTSRRAMLTAEQMGVQVKIVTGDSPTVAGAVAQRLGLIRTSREVITGEQLARMSEAEAAQTVRTYHVFARMTPQSKFQLLQALRHQGRTVGFLGEGINDAPALKLASVALVVDSAADVAREAADIVLLDRSLEVVIEGIRQGRTIYVNILKYVKYTLVGNFGNFFAIAGISLITDFLPMLPVQILLTNILTDFPLIAVATDRVDPAETKQPQHFRLRELGFLTLTLGLVSSLFDFIFFGIFRTSAPTTIQTLWFTYSIISELALIFVLRTSRPIQQARGAGLSLIWLTVVAGLITVSLPFTAYGQHTFHLVRPSSQVMLIIAGLVLSYVVMTEIVKRLYYRQYQYHPTKP